MIGLDQDHSSWIHNENKVNQQLSIFITSLANKAKILIDAKLVLMCLMSHILSLSTGGQSPEQEEGLKN